ncbi:MAG TPA: hypothetical protein VIV40_19310 [Kofleriaceae bacterium]
MRQEAKEVDGFELEHAEERKRESELVEENDEELHDLDGKPEYELEQGSADLVSRAMHKILERQHIVINDLDLSKRELRALEALKTAVDGRDQEINGFVFAEDRRALLEQALAVLQPDILLLEKLGGAAYQELVKEVAELRGKLNVLEDAQEEVEHKGAADKGEATDRDDKPKPDDDQSLTGPERKIAKPASELTGPERKQEPKPATTLTGPEVKPEPKAATTLTGPEIKPEPKPPTSLGDPKEIEETAKKPWWKRLTGG